jgi:hypothetical protein
MNIEKVAHYAAGPGGFSYTPGSDMWDGETHRAAAYLLGRGFARMNVRFSNGVDISALHLTETGVEAWTTGKLLAGEGVR